MEKGITLTQYFNILSDKAVNMGLFLEKAEEKYKEQLTDAEYREYIDRIKPENEKISREALSSPDAVMKLLERIYVDPSLGEDAFDDINHHVVTREGMEYIVQMANKDRINKVFQGVDEKVYCIKVETWEEMVDETPKIERGQLVPVSKVLSGM